MEGVRRMGGEGEGEDVIGKEGVRGGACTESDYCDGSWMDGD